MIHRVVDLVPLSCSSLLESKIMLVDHGTCARVYDCVTIHARIDSLVGWWVKGWSRGFSPVCTLRTLFLYLCIIDTYAPRDYDVSIEWNYLATHLPRFVADDFPHHHLSNRRKQLTPVQN